MDSRVLRRRAVFAADIAIAASVAFSAAFFLIVMEYCVGNGELTHAQLALLGGKAHAVHAGPIHTPRKTQ
jgi:hypothetical protein